MKTPDFKPYAQMSSAERASAAARLIWLFDSDSRYHGRSFKVGRACALAVVGRILTEAEIEELEASDKIPIQTPEALSPVNSILGMLDGIAKDGVPLAVGGEDAPKAEVLNIILKSIAGRCNMARVMRQVAKDTIITSYPTFAWLEPVDYDNPDEQGLSVEYQRWDSVIPSPKWKSWNLRDCDRIMRVKTYAPASLEEAFPEADLKGLHTYMELDATWSLADGSAEDRDLINQRIREGRETLTKEGEVAVVELLEWVRIPYEVAIMPTGDKEILPFDWTPEMKQAWAEEHDAELRTEKTRVLWSTIATLSGVLLACGPHWLQAGVYPCVPMLPSMVDGRWYGIVETAMDTLKAHVYAATEWIHSLRLVNNNLMKIREGAVEDLEQLSTEAKRAGGIIVVSNSAQMDDVQFVENRREQTGFTDWMAQTQDQLARLMVERNFEGGSQSSQESAKVVQSRIQQVSARLSDFTNGWHHFRMELHRTILKALPYAVTQEKIYRLFDPENGLVQVEVNKPVEWDIEGNPVAYINDLGAGEYDYVMVEADNSPTGKEHERAVFMEFLASLGNTPPEAIGLVAANFPNRMVQQFGQQLIAQQEAAAQQKPDPLENTRTQVSLDINSLAGNEMALKAAVNLGILKPEDVQAAPAQATPEELPIQEPEAEHAMEPPMTEMTEAPNLDD